MERWRFALKCHEGIGYGQVNKLTNRIHNTQLLSYVYKCWYIFKKPFGCCQLIPFMETGRLLVRLILLKLVEMLIWLAMMDKAKSEIRECIPHFTGDRTPDVINIQKLHGQSCFHSFRQYWLKCNLNLFYLDLWRMGIPSRLTSMSIVLNGFLLALLLRWTDRLLDRCPLQPVDSGNSPDWLELIHGQQELKWLPLTRG